MSWLALMAWRLPEGETDWRGAEAALEALPEEELVNAYRECLYLDEDDEEELADDARDAAWRGLAELQRAQQGHGFAATLEWPGGVRALVVGGDSGFDAPFEGWEDLAFAAQLGLPEAAGWVPAREVFAPPPAEVTVGMAAAPACPA